MANGYNKVRFKGSKEDCTPTTLPPVPQCDPIKTLNISMGVISGVTCDGEMFHLPVNVINPKTNANQSINEVLKQLCDADVIIKSADDCVYIEDVDCGQEISLDLHNLVSKICNDENLRDILTECVEGDHITITDFVYDEGSVIITQSNGDSFEINIPEFEETVTPLIITDTGFSYTNEAGETVTYVSPIENITSVVDNNDGTFTFTNENDETTIIDYCNCPPVSVTSDDGTLTVVNRGTVENPIFDLSANYTVDINTDTFAYDPSSKTITLTETDGTVHNINVADLVDVETVTTMVIQIDGSTIYTNEDGVKTTIAAPVTLKSTDNTINIESTGTASAPCYDISSVIPPSIQIQSAVFDSNTNTLTITETDGDLFPVDLSSLVSESETVTSIVDTGTSFSYTNEIGETVIVNYCCDDVVTNINPDDDGGFTYINEIGEIVTVSGFCKTVENLPDVGEIAAPLKVVTFDPIDGGCGIGNLPLPPVYDFDVVDSTTQTIVTWTVDGVENVFTIIKPKETNGVHFSGQPEFTGNILTFPTVNDEDESSATPFQVDFSAFVSAPAPIQSVIGSGDITTISDTVGNVTLDYTDIDLVYAGGANVTTSGTGTSDDPIIFNVDCMQPLINGCDANGVSTPLVKGDGVLRDDIDPLTDCSQENGVRQFGLAKSKSGQQFRLSVNAQSISATGTGTSDAITSDTAVGTVILETNCRTVQIPDCGGRLSLTFVQNYQVTTANANGGDALVTPQYSVDAGATWIGMLDGGQDAIQANSSILDKEHVDFSTTAVLPSGATVVCFRVIVAGNDLNPGSVIGNPTQQTGRIKFMEHRHCAI